MNALERIDDWTEENECLVLEWKRNKFFEIVRQAVCGMVLAAVGGICLTMPEIVICGIVLIPMGLTVAFASIMEIWIAYKRGMEDEYK